MTTMTDARCVNTFVNELRFNVLGNYSAQTPQRRGAAMHAAVTRVHQLCGVPATTVQVQDLGQNSGLFQFSQWRIDVNAAEYPDAHVDVNDIHPYFVHIAETMYHEARHCEQWWLIARMLAGNARSPAFLAQATGNAVLRTQAVGSAGMQAHAAQYISRQMGIPRNIATRAVANPIDGRHPQIRLIESWHKSVYGASFREGVLTALALRRRNVPGEGAVLLNDFRTNIHREYSGNLPEEKDAWGIQQLVRDAFERYQKS